MTLLSELASAGFVLDADTQALIVTAAEPHASGDRPGSATMRPPAPRALSSAGAAAGPVGGLGDGLANLGVGRTGSGLEDVYEAERVAQPRPGSVELERRLELVGELGRGELEVCEA
jgi:hypothetical protein